MRRLDKTVWAYRLKFQDVCDKFVKALPVIFKLALFRINPGQNTNNDNKIIIKNLYKVLHLQVKKCLSTFKRGHKSREKTNI